MLWAIGGDGVRMKAAPGVDAVCPCCRLPVRAKCGAIVAWHWSHVTNDCDPWSEPESAWHLAWKARFPEAWQEVVVGKHRTDIQAPKTAIEFQSSHLPPDDIVERENYYDLHCGGLVWMVRGHDFRGNMNFRNKGDYWSFRWKWPRKSWWSARCSLYIDFGNGRIFHVKKLNDKVPCGGWGNWVGVDDFMEACISGTAKAVTPAKPAVAIKPDRCVEYCGKELEVTGYGDEKHPYGQSLYRGVLVDWDYDYDTRILGYLSKIGGSILERLYSAGERKGFLSLWWTGYEPLPDLASKANASIWGDEWTVLSQWSSSPWSEVFAIGPAIQADSGISDDYYTSPAFFWEDDNGYERYMGERVDTVRLPDLYHVGSSAYITRCGSCGDYVAADEAIKDATETLCGACYRFRPD